MGLKLKNNAASTLSATITGAQTSLTVAAGTGARFPVLAAGDWFPAALIDTSGNMEYVKVTARVGDTMTILRAQESTGARGFPSGSSIMLPLTVDAIASLEVGSGPLAVSIDNSVVSQ